MAGNDELKVGIGSDISGLQKGIADAEKEIERLRKIKASNLKLGIDTTDINRQLDATKAKLNSLTGAAKTTGQAMTNLKGKTADGSQALQGFSRIAQDAPYGIIGVGNNITALAEQFSYLSKNAGGTGGALKAMVSSLTGVGGVLLAVSLVTTALTIMSQQGLTVGDVIDKLTGNFDELGQSMAQANEQAAKSAGSEIASMKALVSVAQDDNLARKDRLIAVQALQKEFPAYFGNLDKEKILNGDLTSVTKELTAAIVARARASAYAGKLGELAVVELGLNNKLVKAKEELIKQEKETNLLKAQGNNLQGQAASASGQAAGASADATRSIKSDIEDIRAELAKNKKAQDVFTSAINESTAASIKLNNVAGTGSKAEKKVFSKDTPQVSAVSTLVQQPLIVPPLNIKPFSDSVDALKLKATEVNMAFTELQLSLNETIQNSLAPALMGVGNAIGEALANGTNLMEGLGQSLLASLGGLLSSLASKMIEYGVLTAAFGVAFESLKNPATAIIAGVALAAIGAALSSKSKEIGSVGRGVSSSSGSSGSQSYSTGTSSGYTGGGGYGSVVFELQGTKLLGVLKNTMDANKRLGI